MTGEFLRRTSPKVFAFMVHDRGTLAGTMLGLVGGLLLAAGVGMLLPTLWCFCRGAAWLWWAVLRLGIPAYGTALGVHFGVGYTDPQHLVPTLAGSYCGRQDWLWVADI